MQNQLKITAHDPNEVNAKDFKFKGLKELRGKFRRAERIVSIDDPDNPDESIHFHLRALTPGEENSLHQALLSQESVSVLVSNFIEQTKDGEPLDTEETATRIAKKMTDDSGNAANERYLRKIQMGMIAPKVSLEWLRELNPALLELFHEAIDDLRIEQERWIVENLFRKAEEQEY